MTTRQLTTGNDTILGDPFLNLDYDGLAGFDTLSLGNQGQHQFTITQSADGAVHVDTISSASQFFHATLYNFEQLVFGDGSRIDLAAYFPPVTPPPLAATLTPSALGPVAGEVRYALSFSDSVIGLEPGDFNVANGSLVAIDGSGANYTVVVSPMAGITGSLGLTLKAASVTGTAGGALTAALSAVAVAVDTLPPSLASSTATDGSLVLNFSEAIQTGSGSVLVKSDSGALVAAYDIAGSPNLSVSGTSLTVSLNGLPLGSHYTLSVPAGGVKDAVGNALAGVVSKGFTTPGTAAQIAGTAGNDKLAGSASNNSFDGAGGDDSIDGAAGTDVALYHGNRAGYTVTVASTPDGSTTVRDNRVQHTVPAGVGDGSDSLTRVERLQFADQSLALDLGVTQAAGKAVLLMAVATNLGPALAGSPAFAGLFLKYFDAGASLLDGASLLVNSGIAAAFAGGSDNASLVNMVYTDVHGQAPDAATLAGLVAPLNAGLVSQAQFMADMAASVVNQQHVQLAGLAATGWAYWP